MKHNHTFEFTDTEVTDIQEGINQVQKIYTAHSPQGEARYDPQRDFVVEYLQKVKAYIKRNVGKTIHLDNRFLPREIPGGFKINGPVVYADGAAAMDRLDVIYYNLPDSLEPVHEAAYENVYGILRAFRRHCLYVARRVPFMG